MLQSTGPVNWEIARQTAEWVALEGRTEPPVAPADREQFEELAHAAQTLVVGETGLTATFATDALAPSGPKGWVDLHLVALRPVLEALATTLGEAMQADDDDADDEPMPAIPGLPPGLAGHGGPGRDGQHDGAARARAARRAGGLDDRLPRAARARALRPPAAHRPAPVGDAPGGDAPSLCFVVANIDAFEAAWSLPRDDLRFYVALHETVHAATRSVPWVRGRLVRLAVDYVSSYEIDPSAFEAEFGMIDPQDPEAMQRMTESPERVLGAMQSPRQVAPREELQRLTVGDRGLRRPRARAASAAGSSPRSTRSTRR